MIRIRLFGLLVLLGVSPISGTGAQEEGIRGEGRLEEIEEWSIQTEVRSLEQSLERYDPLIQSLGEANDDLKVDLARFMKDPQSELLASHITMKMSAYARTIVADFDLVISYQDVLLDTFSELRRKLTHFRDLLRHKEAGYGREVEQYEVRGRELSEQLTAIARQCREAGDGEEALGARRDFIRLWRRYRINQRYVNGYGRNRKDYAALSGNIEDLLGVFRELQESFVELVEHLGAEKKFLLANIELNADCIQVTQLVNEGIRDGGRLVGQLSRKLALLYHQVDAFARIQQQVQGGLGRFAESQQVLVGAARQIDRVGALEATPDVERAIDEFYQRRTDEE